MTRIVPTAALCLVLASCASPSGPDATAPSAIQDHGLTVYAAASLGEALEGIATAFEALHPGWHVLTNYAGSSDLAAQINEGAPADVFLSANEAQMDAVAGNIAGAPVVFASNYLTIAVPEGNPGAITGLADFADPDQVTVICAPEVPCGDAARSLAASVGLTLTPSSEEGNVTDVLGKVASGQADGGLVYITDIARAEGVAEVPIPEAADVRNLYTAAVLTGAAGPEMAAAFIDYLTGEAAQAVLADAGFGAP